MDARTLHESIGSKQEFANWIKKRINDCNLLEGHDFLSFDNVIKREKGATKLKDYWLTLDAAKHLAMIEKNAQGFKIRQYFIQAEKQLRAVVTGNAMQTPCGLSPIISQLNAIEDSLSRLGENSRTIMHFLNGRQDATVVTQSDLILKYSH